MMGALETAPFSRKVGEKKKKNMFTSGGTTKGWMENLKKTVPERAKEKPAYGEKEGLNQTSRKSR